MPVAPPPVVSVGLPVRNGGNYLQGAIDSVLGQDFGDFELIISDNGSTDETEAICRAAARRDARVQYHRQVTNLGSQGNFDFVLQAATGRYFKWLAHDDLCAPEFLTVCVAALKADPGLVLVHPSTVLIDANGDVTGGYIDRLDSDSPDPVARFARWMQWGHHMCNPIFGLFPREVLTGFGPLAGYAGFDHVFLGQVALKGRVRRLPQGLLLRRVHPGMSSQARRGALATASWMSGITAKGLHFRHFRILRGFADAIWHSDLSPAERTRAAVAVVKWVGRSNSKFIREVMLPLYLNGQPTRLNLWVRRVSGYDARKRSRSSGTDTPPSQL